MSKAVLHITKYDLIKKLLDGEVEPAYKDAANAAKFLTAYRLCKQTEKEALFMMSCASKVINGGRILEIGRKYGGSMILMCIANPKAKMYSMDFKPKWFELSRKLAEVYGVGQDRFKMITADSRKYKWDRKKAIDFLFLDGNEFYDDLVRYSPFVRKGGMIMVNGYMNKYKSGIRQEVESFVARRNPIVKPVGTFRMEKLDFLLRGIKKETSRGKNMLLRKT